MLPEPLQVAAILVEIFDRLELQYLVGGSVASSILGVERATQDIDFVVDLAEKDIERLVAALGEDFYADADLLREAVRTVSSANVIHLPTMIKADLFVLSNLPFARAQMVRRIRLPMLGSDQPLVCVASAEDMVLQKLLWYRMTGERSEKQWSDVQGILRIQAKSLDLDYLTEWADALELTDLLAAVQADASSS